MVYEIEYGCIPKKGVLMLMKCDKCGKYLNPVIGVGGDPDVYMFKWVCDCGESRNMKSTELDLWLNQFPYVPKEITFWTVHMLVTDLAGEEHKIEATWLGLFASKDDANIYGETAFGRPEARGALFSWRSSPATFTFQRVGKIIPAEYEDEKLND